MQDLKVSLIQCNQVWEDKKANLAHYETMLEEVQLPTDIVVFPEMFQTGFTMNAVEMAESINGESVQWMKKMAAKYECAIAASLIIQEGDQFFNRMVFIQADGSLQQYNKRKLFGLAKEDHTYSSGEENTIFEYKGWKILLQVCYDLRFPEVMRNKVENDVYDYDLMINVANWPEKRSLHWRTLLRARAIENQVYVIGVNRVGEDKNGLNYSGDSCIIAPSGIDVADVSYDEYVVNEELEAETLKLVREKMPFLKDR
ncbi:amidohydrolase [Brumimicrobium aurantiacum]|uniref:Omega-amidase YafV n=1 Tax=Brumimicrobium aurantiacum TaxID=1737063 RepID=A0A3E1F1X7_9FLAO|nr:amidohydrolase [Brumimicrobium aurantiacum]RFC55828.1 amidohydrolase [Brumimicrobium aurantiacum]